MIRVCIVSNSRSEILYSNTHQSNLLVFSCEVSDRPTFQIFWFVKKEGSDDENEILINLDQLRTNLF